MRIALVSDAFLPAVDRVVARLMRTLKELSRPSDNVLVIAPAAGPESYACAQVVAICDLRVPRYPDGDGYGRKRVSLPGPTVSKTARVVSPGCDPPDQPRAVERRRSVGGDAATVAEPQEAA